jgi:hypothetical protein
MALFDGKKNFAVSAVATAPSPASSGTSLVVTGGTGTLFPSVPFNAVVWPASLQPTSSNAEVVRVTAISTDTFTITRAQESSSARSIIVGDQISNNVTIKTITDLESSIRTLLYVNQTTHGFSAGDVVRSSGSSDAYAKAKADSASNAEVAGIVDSVVDTNNFVLLTSGVFTSGVPAVAAGTVVFLDPSTAGAMTSTEPSTVGQVSKPVAVVLNNATRAIFLNYRGMLISQTSRQVQTLYADGTQTGNTAATETTLFTYTIPASTLTTTGDSVDFTSAGTIAATAATDKRIKVKFGATTLIDTGTMAITAGADWRAEGRIVRTGATAQKAHVTISTSSSVMSSTTDYTAPAETLSGTVALVVTGQGTNANDVVGQIVKMVLAPG